MPAATIEANARRSLYTRLAVVAAAAAVVGAAITSAACGGGESKPRELAPTEPPPTATSTVPPTPSNDQVLAFLIAIAPTATPRPAGGGGGAPRSSGGGGGGGAPQAVARPNLPGPGPIYGTGWGLTAPSIGLNASISGRQVGQNGTMGDPQGAWMALWYDFTGWDGMGGQPGEPGANVVISGHVDYIRVGPAVFYSVGSLAPGDQVTVNGPTGPITYAIQWNAWSGPNDDFTQYVTKTGQEVITLITCIGQFSAGHYSNRLIVRGVRI